MGFGNPVSEEICCPSTVLDLKVRETGQKRQSFSKQSFLFPWNQIRVSYSIHKHRAVGFHQDVILILPFLQQKLKGKIESPSLCFQCRGGGDTAGKTIEQVAYRVTAHTSHCAFVVRCWVSSVYIYFDNSRRQWTLDLSAISWLQIRWLQLLCQRHPVAEEGKFGVCKGRLDNLFRVRSMLVEYKIVATLPNLLQNRGHNLQIRYGLPVLD